MKFSAVLLATAVAGAVRGGALAARAGPDLTRSSNAQNARKLLQGPSTQQSLAQIGQLNQGA